MSERSKVITQTERDALALQVAFGRVARHKPIKSRFFENFLRRRQSPRRTLMSEKEEEFQKT